MKKFLFPTDFSDAAYSAYRYALGLASELGSSLTVLHILPPVVSPVEYFSADNELTLDEKRSNWAKEQLEKYRRFSELKKVAIKSVIETGNPVKEIVNESKDFDLVLMGTRGVRETYGNPLGSVAGGVIQLTDTPVMIIPEEVAFYPYDHIMYATESKLETPDNLGFVASLVNKFHPRLSFLHINQDKKDDNFVYEAVEQVYENENSTHQTGWYTFNQSDILSGLESFALNKYVDLIVMKTHQRDYLDRLFEASLSKEMALNSRIPLLILKELEV